MIIKLSHTLTISQRKRIKNIQKNPTKEYGILVRTINNTKYHVGIIVGGKNETSSSIEVCNLETDQRYSQIISRYIIGNWTIDCGEDIIELEVK